jgi:hypothetical protein
MDRVIAAQVYNRICELGSLSAARVRWGSPVQWSVAIWNKWKSGRGRGWSTARRAS